MVKKEYHQNIDGGLPPMDESWWEAVLAENGVEEVFQSRKTANQNGHYGDSGAARSVGNNNAMDWDKAQELFGLDQTVQMQVTGYNRGGLLVENELLQGFVPVSHLVDLPEEQIELEQDDWLGRYLGRQLTLKVIECDQGRGRVVLSERAALAAPGRRHQLLNMLLPGECVSGTVTNITDFGVFVDLGGVEGLVHVSEISWGRVRHPRDVVELGETVQVYVIHVDRDKARVALSLKRLCANPWETAEQRYQPGQMMEAVVTSIVPFGAFARLEEGLDGLIHISEICPEEDLPNPTDVLHEGQLVHVRVLHVDGPKQRLGLSFRREDNLDSIQI